VADKSRLGRAEPDKSESGVLTPKIHVSAGPAEDSLRFGFGDPDLTNSGLLTPTVYYFWNCLKTNIISGLNIKKCII
jgi:hypothetical protein